MKMAHFNELKILNIKQEIKTNLFIQNIKLSEIFK